MRHSYTVEVYPVSSVDDEEYPFRVPMLVRSNDPWFPEFFPTEARIRTQDNAAAVRASMLHMVRDVLACALDDEEIARDVDLHWVPARWEEEDTA